MSSGRVRASTHWSADGTPQRAAMAATVRGLSPEITFVVTDSAPKNAMVSAASGRTSSAHTTRAAGTRSGGTVPAGRRPPAARPTTSTRIPASACTWAAASASSPLARRTSGAPRYHAPPSSKSTALYLYADANGMRSRTVQPAASGRPAAMAAMVGSGCGSAAANAPRAASTGRSPSRRWTWSSTTDPVVSVPVLSVASSVTRASVSTACSCCTRTLARPSRITATACAMLNRSTSPCGTRATRPATVPISASSSGSPSP